MRKNFSLLIVGILIGVFLPVFGCWAGEYGVSGNFINTGQGSGRVQYDGLVPCGKCVKVTEEIAITPSDLTSDQVSKNADERSLVQKRFVNFKDMTVQYCGVASKDVDTQIGTVTNAKIKKDTSIYINCQLCHFFILIQGVISFLLINIIPYLAVLMIVIGGAMFYFGGAKPELVQRGKKLIFGVIIGLFLIYGAYIIVNFFLSVIKLATVNPVSSIFKDGIFSIKCPVKIF